MSLKAILAAVAAASGSVLAITHLGANPVAPGADLGVSIEINTAADAIIVRADAGNLTAFVRLTIAPLTTDVFSAQLEDGAALGATSTISPGGTVLNIHKAGAGPTEKFEWPSGVSLRISRTLASGSAPSVAVANWEVFSKEGQSDTRSKARRRTIWQWFSMILLLLTGAGAIVAARKKEEQKQAFGSKDCIESLIGEIDGDTAEQTQHIRTFLRKRVLEGATYDEAIGATGLTGNPAIKVAGKALSYFPERLERLIFDLLRVDEELQPKPGNKDVP